MGLALPSWHHAAQSASLNSPPERMRRAWYGERGFVDVEHHRGLQAGEGRVRGAVVLGEGIPLAIRLRFEKFLLCVAEGLDVDEVVLVRGLRPQHGVEVVVRGGALRGRFRRGGCGGRRAVGGLRGLRRRGAAGEDEGGREGGRGELHHGFPLEYRAPVPEGRRL
jgi:hypothetical protein